MLASPLSVDAIGASSLLLVAIPSTGNATAVMTNIMNPSGQTLVTLDPNDLDPIGKNLFQQIGYAVTAGILPHSTTYTFENGRYQFQIGNPNGSPVSTQVLAVLNRRLNPTAGALDLNLVFCGIQDLDSQSALTNQDFLLLFNEFQRILAQVNIQVGTVHTFDCPASLVGQLAVVNGTDEQALLFSLNPPAGNEALNVFFVQDIQLQGIAGVLGVSGGIPGPARIQGTGASGVGISLVASRIGDLTASDLLRRGRTMAHEVGHYVGLFHTTERTGSTPNSPTNFINVDPIPDTPECLLTVDQPPTGDGDQSVDPTECGVGGGARNLMFWTQGPDALGARDQISPDQAFVMLRNPLVR
ncbi:hypothetical protein YTPLAS18_32640 [Nitrospira sp.]|nr:hypothetical protein YTPLAS18_32640 [Nitrospira sp.]